MNYVIAALPPEIVIPVFRDIWGVLEPAVKRAPRSIRYTYESLLIEIAQKKTQLWLVIDPEGNDLIGAFTTAIATDERFKDQTMLEVPLLAGKKMSEWLGDALKLVLWWGRAEGATVMVGYGRKGWERAAGFEYFGETDDGVRIMTRTIGLEH